MTMRGMKHPIVLLLVFPFFLLALVFVSTPITFVSNGRDSLIPPKRGCNYGLGHWVLDITGRPRYSVDCRFHRSAWNCGKNRKPGVERVSQWRWMPSNCTSWVSMEPRSFLHAVRGMRLGFIGDSLNENFMVSLLCSLSAVDDNASKWKRRGTWRGAYFPSFDVTVGYHRAVLLSKFAKVQNLPGLGSGFRVDIDIPADDWVNATQFYDALVFNTGHWWGYDKFPKESPLVFYKQGHPVWPSLSIREGLAAVLKSMLDFIDDAVPAHVLKVWRLQSPRHFQGGEWNQNGSCSSATLLNNTQVEEWFDPVNGGVNMEEREINHMIRSALSDRPDFVVLDVAAMSEFRADAHPSLWLGSKDAHLAWGQDCLHWCLPGVPDSWVDMLSAVVLEHIQNAKPETRLVAYNGTCLEVTSDISALVSWTSNFRSLPVTDGRGRWIWRGKSSTACSSALSQTMRYYLHEEGVLRFTTLLDATNLTLLEEFPCVKLKELSSNGCSLYRKRRSERSNSKSVS